MVTDAYELRRQAERQKDFEIVISMGYIHSKIPPWKEKEKGRKEGTTECTGEVEEGKTDVWKDGDAQHSVG